LFATKIANGRQRDDINRRNLMSYTSLRYHLVWSTKHRKPLITAAIERHLWGALRSKIKALGGVAFIINGTEDHVHLVVAIPASMAVESFVRDIKAHASRVARKLCPEFRWQDGFAAFTVSAREMDDLIDYVANQKPHHASGTIVDELEVSN